jgi:hypothetical protein
MDLPPRALPSLSVDGSGAGIAQTRKNQSIKTFAAALSTASVVFGIQIIAFLILSGNWKIRKSKNTGEKAAERQSLFHKIYFYKTSFVSKRKRISEPTTALESFKNVFTISDRELIRIAGVDGFLFLQYLQLLLKIFVPMAILLLPILLPVNRKGDVPGVSGLDSFAWPNLAVPKKLHRLWAHVFLAIVVVIWTCYNFYLAMRKFVRLRQTILTTPEHRMRASATTILVQSIPRKWLTVAALDALYDVFPGGIRAIWINRDYDELQEKVNKRTKIARMLEEAESKLIIKCTKKHMELEEKRQKEAGIKKTKVQKKQDETAENAHITQNMEAGTSSGNPHEIEQTLQQVLVVSPSGSSSSSSSRSSSPDSQHKRAKFPIEMVGEGIQAVGEGIRDVGHGVGKIGSKFVGGVKGAFGGKREGSDAPPQLDGTDQHPVASPTSAEFDARGASSDTYSPLNIPDEKNRVAEDPIGGQPTLPQSAVKVQPNSAPPKGDTPAPVKRTPFHPFRRVSDMFTSPQPYRAPGEEYPLESEVPKEPIKYDYTGVWNDDYAEDDESALWRQYLKPNERESMRIPVIKKNWWPSLPLIGKKVDTIYYCRKELARLNHEIAEDQAHPENFELMNSAFIQFNHQVAAHMACQALSHHIPRQMTPRTVEVNPNYVMWDNLSVRWWARYLRMGTVILAIIGLIIFWGIPVSATGLLSQVSALANTWHWLAWLEDLPTWLISFIQGVLPPAVLGLLFVILPVILRALAGLTGTATTGERELLVQNFYFTFVFIQLFLVVSLSSGVAGTLKAIVRDPISIPATLAQYLPSAANYFFSYMILQAFSISSGTLLQIAAVASLVIFRWFDTTPRQKVARILSRPGINWGNMIPVYTNLAAIGLVYSVIAPLIIIMLLITFSLFWFTYRYQMIYVSYAKAETNGLIFPKAINQLFTGLYFLLLCLIGLFFLVKDEHDNQACVPHAIIMIVVLAFTLLFQVLLNRAFGPLFTYLPTTFEDEAVERDEEFQRKQAARWQSEHHEHQSLNSELEEKEDKELRESRLLEEKDRDQRKSREHHRTEDIEMKKMETVQHRNTLTPYNSSTNPSGGRWADKARSRSRSHSRHKASKRDSKRHGSGINSFRPLNALTSVIKTGLDDAAKPIRDLEAQTNPAAYLFDDIDDTLEDIEPEVRQKLIKRAFQHPATRALQPAIWIPHDQLGISNDEIEKTGRFSDRIWITSVNARLDASGNVVYRGLPPDRDPFQNIEV